MPGQEGAEEGVRQEGASRGGSGAGGSGEGGKRTNSICSESKFNARQFLGPFVMNSQEEIRAAMVDFSSRVSQS